LLKLVVAKSPGKLDIHGRPTFGSAMKISGRDMLRVIGAPNGARNGCALAVAGGVTIVLAVDGIAVAGIEVFLCD
jgi:hypothetical protein